MVPFELVDAVLADTRSAERRLRVLPSRVGVYFLLAMCLFPEIGYRLVWDKMTTALAGMPMISPTAKALRDLHRGLGSAPVKALFEVLAGALAQPTTPGVRFGPYRLVSFDGCSSQKVPGTERNRAWLGRSCHHGYPTLELMTLVESGTRALIGALFGPTAEGETSYARRLLHLVTPGMLVLWDKGFDSNNFLAAVTRTGAQVPGRLRDNRRTPRPDPARRRLLPVGHRHGPRPDRRRAHHGDLRGRHHLRGVLPSGHSAHRRPPLPGIRPGHPLPPEVGCTSRRTTRCVTRS